MSTTTLTAGVTTTTALDVAKALYPSFTHDDHVAAAESIALFTQQERYAPRTPQELEAWLDGADAYGAYLKANGGIPKPTGFGAAYAALNAGLAAQEEADYHDDDDCGDGETGCDVAYEAYERSLGGDDDSDDDEAEAAELEAAERRAAELRAKREAKAAAKATAPKPIPAPQPAGIIGAGSVTRTAALDRKTLGRLWMEQFGFKMPGSWNRTHIAEAMHGVSYKPGTIGKKCAQWHYTRVTGATAAKSWTVDKLTTELSKTEPSVPKSKACKTAATLAYVKLTGFMPAKGWTTVEILDKTKSNTLPRSHRRAASVVNGAIVLA